MNLNDWVESPALGLLYLRADTSMAYIDKNALVIREDGTGVSVATDLVLAGPFESLDAAKAAYLVMVS